MAKTALQRITGTNTATLALGQRDLLQRVLCSIYRLYYNRRPCDLTLLRRHKERIIEKNGSKKDKNNNRFKNIRYKYYTFHPTFSTLQKRVK